MIKKIFKLFNLIFEADGPIFEKAIFAGRERTLFIFDAILFLFVDYYSNNFVLASFVVYVVSKVNACFIFNGSIFIII